MPFTCRHQRVVRLSATLLMLARGGRAAGCLRWRVCVRTGTSGASLWLVEHTS